MEQLTQIIAKYSPEPEFLLLIIFLFSLGKSVIFYFFAAATGFGHADAGYRRR
ncbi:Uncharacterised protein [Serratia quinivorans]|uniref:Uncharacterized protein n=1 Tax=Serratia quinivorans TaxID=137545 RepID=A0A379YF17_9GAMM|nr:Uncharacterised protein [Serratia quinivorans]